MANNKKTTKRKKQRKIDTQRGRCPVLLSTQLHSGLKRESVWRKQNKLPNASLESVADEIVQSGMNACGLFRPGASGQTLGQSSSSGATGNPR